MTKDDITAALRSAKGTMTAVELAELAGKLAGTGPTQSTIVMAFKQAFPAIPLRVLLEAGAWMRVSGGGMTDEEFNELLRPWLCNNENS
jgi:hypothetical protein